MFNSRLPGRGEFPGVDLMTLIDSIKLFVGNLSRPEGDVACIASYPVARAEALVLQNKLCLKN